MKNISLKSKLNIIGLIAIALYIFPYILLGESSYIKHADFMTGIESKFIILAHSNMIFADNYSIIPNIMGGLPRISFQSEFNILVWMYKIFEPFTVYIINQIFIHFTAYIGMFFLLDRYILNRGLSNREYIIVGVSLAFALLPFWPMGGLSIAGLPLATFVFLNIYNHKERWYDWLIIVLIPFYSSFILSFSFFLFFASLFFLYNIILTKKFHKKLFFAILLMTLVYLAIEYRLILGMLIPSDYVSHRKEMDITIYGSYMKNIRDLFISTLELFLTGKGGAIHVSAFHKYFINIAVLLALFLGFLNRDKKIKLLVLLLLILFFNAFIYQLWYYPPFNTIKDKIHLFKMFHFGRFLFLSPFIWYIVFAISLEIILREIPRRKYAHLIVFSLLLLQIFGLTTKHEQIVARNNGLLNYKDFYDTSLFAKIKNYLGYPQKKPRVACIGFYPSIAIYNGLYTIDGYINNYPLSYKHKFKKINERFYENTPEREEKFDKHGHFCYLELSDLKSISKGSGSILNKIVDPSELNFDQMKKLGAEYIISAYPLKQDKHLLFKKVFSQKNSKWTMYIYKIK